ncbi:MAG: polyhydroxyalkanoate synthesis regulator DNA-binding domain-containing protein [Bdellovibrionales bacterium]|nr:polyhydroxyalkanoate synthesis regulator DNA-binding domain-containing protein [Bdellovibrionales bacterium]
MDQNIINRAASMSHSPRQTKAKVIKRYGNRKLYDTEQSSYVVLNDIAKMIRNEEEVRVIDNETKDDITSATLTQIIFGAEKKSSYSTPLDVLKSIIKKGDGSFSNFLAEMGLFKAQITDNKITIEENGTEEMARGSYTPPSPHRHFQNKTLQERVANAALSPDSTENENTTILPTSNNNIVGE